MLSAAQAKELAGALAERFGASEVEQVRPVGGGCISTTLQVRLRGGATVFVKLATAAPPAGALLEAEAFSLRALRATGTVRVPEVLARGESWLALEWLEPGSGEMDAWERLGRALAGLHRATSPRFGWARDNFIGTLPQANAPLSDWASFWWERRLAPQLARAKGSGLLTAAEVRAFEPLTVRLPALLAVGQAEGASLLHGDLWSGNVHMTAGGEPAVVDPASYSGHREVDLAMSALFGGFAPAFYRAYAECWPLVSSGLEQRRAAYQLYYLLVHVNLFGRGYVAGTMAALRTALH